MSLSSAAPLDMADVSRETSPLLGEYFDLLLAENERQNLISRVASEADDLWRRHILDSVQLLGLAEQRGGRWLDIGSGGGLPGMVVAIMGGGEVTLAEPRRLRAEFLERTAQALGIADRVRVEAAKAQALKGSFDVISARAVAPLDQLFAMSEHLTHSGTKYLLMKGRSAQSELEEARRTWQGRFTLVPSQTDPEAAIVVASGVRRRRRG